jgi:hypothetical protein
MPSPNPQILPCRACSSPPLGIDGHAQLRVQFLGSAQMLFRCEYCNRVWARTGPREGPFQWAAASITNTHRSSPGLAVPPRTDPQTSFG